jgi:squalene-hopene/tetraprenyl-beta-curcumene cyclase
MNSGDRRYGTAFSVGRLPESDGVEDLFEGFATPLQTAIESARDWLLEQQAPDGYWVGELEGDTILESEYILLLTWLGRSQTETVQQCAEYIRTRQMPCGGWNLFPGGPVEISASVKAYWALKIAGDDPGSSHMERARQAIRAAGGAERVNSFTRYYFALLGIIAYRQCPAVPPELMLLPRWFPINIHEMSSWSRTILVPLSLLWAFQPKCELPPGQRIDELFLDCPEKLPVVMPPSQQLDSLTQPAMLPWHAIFNGIDRVWKFFERLRLKPFRERSIKLAARWMIRRFEKSDGLGAIFPPIIWSVIALRCLGYEESSPEVQTALNELEKLTIREGNTARLEPCRSPVWDTALAINALRESGVPAHDPQISRGVEWLLSKEVRSPGDWSVAHPQLEPGGWFFEFNNEFYPDIDDTIMVTMALARCLPGGSHVDWSASLLNPQLAHPSADFDLAIIIAGQTAAPERVVSEVERMQPIIAAMRRAVRWTMAMQSRNGGWAAFDADNDREILTRVPFADHNAMIDPPTADITARVLEMFGRLGLQSREPAFERALKFLWDHQEADHCWYGRWGVNYLYGTWQVLVGLKEFGIPAEDARMQAAARWLKEHQQANGGWGETPRSYDEPHLRGTGPTTPSQTAWALMGLMAAGEVGSVAVRRGIDYLTNTQTDAGTWVEDEYTGTGFPRVFYLRYHLYRHYFPLMALGRYAALTGTLPG